MSDDTTSDPQTTTTTSTTTDTDSKPDTGSGTSKGGLPLRGPDASSVDETEEDSR